MKKPQFKKNKCLKPLQHYLESNPSIKDNKVKDWKYVLALIQKLEEYILR